MISLDYVVEVGDGYVHCRSRHRMLSDDVFIWFKCTAEDIWLRGGMWVLQVTDAVITQYRVLELLNWVLLSGHKTMAVTFTKVED